MAFILYNKQNGVKYMTTSWRGFRYQTGEVEAIAEKLKEGQIVPVDIDDDREIDALIQDLETQGIYKIADLEVDTAAVDTVENPEFRFRRAFYTESAKAKQIAEDKRLYIDFYTIEEPEESYDDVFWG